MPDADELRRQGWSQHGPEGLRYWFKDLPAHVCGIHHEAPDPARGYANGLIMPTLPISWSVFASFGPFPQDTKITHITYWSGERCERIFDEHTSKVVPLYVAEHSYVTIIWTAGGLEGFVPPPPYEALRS